MATEKDKTAASGAGADLKKGAEKEDPAVMTPLVAGPGGLQPVSAVARTPEQAKTLIKQRERQIEEERNHPRASEELSEDLIRSLSGAERRAIAESRGYGDLLKGRTVSADALIKMQKEDDGLRPARRAKRETAKA